MSTTIWHSRISPAARYSCVSTAIKNLSESPAGRRSRRGQYINRDQQSKGIYGATVCHQRGISTAFSKSKAHLPQLYITSAVYQPRSAKQKHTRRNCISTPRYTNRDQQREIISATAVYQQRGTLTAISTAGAYISDAAIYQQPSKG